MEAISIMRLLRKKYGISLRELADAVNVTNQYISDLELGKYIGEYDFKKNNEPLMQTAFESVIEKRVEQARRLSEEYAENRHRLLDFVTEDNHEL